MLSPDPMFCKGCYANLDQAIDDRCAKCNRIFDRADRRTYLVRPFPSKPKIIVHTLIMLLFATAISFIVATFLGLAQLKFIHSGH